jgi:hypothetical protein
MMRVQKARRLFGVHYFYGQPTQLETYQRTDLTTVQYGFEVKLDKATVPSGRA